MDKVNGLPVVPSTEQARKGITPQTNYSTATKLEITRYTAHKPERLSKHFELKNGELVKTSGGMLIEGEAERIKLYGLTDFGQMLDKLTPAQALGYGISEHEHARIVTKNKVEIIKATVGEGTVVAIARSRDYMEWAEGAGVLLCDYDPPDNEQCLTPEQLLELLYKTCPDLRDAPHLVRPSVSSCIVNTITGEKLRGVKGLHVYLLVKEASDIPRAGQVLYDRLWLAGKGWVKISVSGSLLLRAPVDASVFQPERLDFAGGALCVPPLAQQLSEPRIINCDAFPLDTRISLPDLTEFQKKEVEQLQAEAKSACATQAMAARAKWMETRLNELVKRYPNITKRRLCGVLKQAVEGKVLGPEFVLFDANWKPISVAELLTDPEHWNGKYIRDPLEPDYGSSVAWVKAQDGDSFIFSHAHGLNIHYELSLARASVELVSGDLAKIVGAVIEVMRADNTLFEHGGELVRRLNGGMEPVKDDWLRVYFARLIHFTKWDGRKKMIVKTDCPPELPRLVLAQRGAWGLPVLRGIINAPLLRPDGSVLGEQGFDLATGLYLDRQVDAHVAGQAKKADIVAALHLLWKPFKEFPFVGSVDRGVMLAAVFTACLRPILPTAPGFGFDAPAAGSGKSLLAKCLAFLAGVNEPAMMPPVEQEDELRKRLLSGLRTGKRVIVLDNQVGPLDSAALCAFLTSAVYGDRVLGQSTVLEFPNTALFIVTGNNFQPMGDLARRILTCRIDAQVERPDKRSFNLDPAAYVAEHRQDMVHAALTLLRGYQFAPIGGRRGAGRMASFEAWDDTIRQAVLWVGGFGVIDLADPLGAIDLAHSLDPDRAKLETLLTEWHGCFGNELMTVAEVIRMGTITYGPTGPNKILLEAKYEGLAEILKEIAGEGRIINPRRLGRWIEKRAGRIVGGWCFERCGTRNGVVLWAVRHK